MSENSDTPSGFEGLDSYMSDPDLIKKLDDEYQASKAQRELLDRVESARSRISGMRIVDVRTQIVIDECKGKDLADRHEALNIEKTVVQTALLGTPDEKRRLQKKIEDEGGFFEHYTPEFVAQRIHDRVGTLADGSGWIIVESLGKPTRKSDFALGDEIVGGDIHLWIHGDTESVKLESSVALDESKGDIIFPNGRDVWEAIQKYPATAAWISDVCSIRGILKNNAEFFQPIGFASSASNKAFQVAEELSGSRKYPLQWSLAAIADVTHVLDAQKNPLATLRPTWLNQRSLDLHRRDRFRGEEVYRSVILGEQVHRLLPVELPYGDKGFLQINWNIVAQELKNPKQL